jgi:hypothetical protein
MAGWQIAMLVAYAGLLLNCGGFLAFGWRFPGTFRIPAGARLRAWSGICLAVGALLVTVTPQRDSSAVAVVVFPALILIGAFFVLLVLGFRAEFRGLEAYPAGKHSGRDAVAPEPARPAFDPGYQPEPSLYRTERGGRRRYLNKPKVWTRGVFLVASGSLVPVVVVPLYLTHLPPGSDGVGEGVMAAFAAAWSSMVILGIRTLRSGIVVGPGGLMVGFVITRRCHVPWPDVAGFQVVPAPRYSSRYRPAVAAAVVSDGRPPLYCIGSSTSAPAQADAMVRALEYERQAWLAGGRRPIAERLPAGSN